MASSGSVDYGNAVTRNNIIEQALQALGVIGMGQTPTSDQYTECAAFLNNIVKQWSGQFDFAAGIKMWSRKRAYLFLDKGQGKYTLGPVVSATSSTDKFANAYVSTTVATNAGAGSTVDLTSVTGVADTYRIGILLDTGYMHWTTVNGAPSGVTVTLTDALPSAAAAGNVVYCYDDTATVQGRRPLEILSVVRRDRDGDDTPLYAMTLEEYEAIPDKDDEGTPLRYYYEPQLYRGELYLDCAPDDLTDVLRIVYVSPVEDFDQATDTVDYDANWLRPLVYGLAVDMVPRYGMDARLPTLKMLRDEALSIARNAHAETSIVYFQPGACD